MENAALMREIVDALPFATLVVSFSGDTVLWNRAAERIFGWRSPEVLGRLNPIVPSDRRDEFRAFQEIVSSGKVLRATSWRQRKDGTLIELKTTMIPLPCGSSEVKHILILHEPIGEPLFLVTRGPQGLREGLRLPGKNRGVHRTPKALSRFTPRQREIIMLVAGGYNNRRIAKQLSVGEQVIKNYLRGIYRELRIRSRTQLVIWLNRQKQHQ